MHQWNDLEVIRKIRDLYENGKSLIYIDVFNNHQSLLNAANRYFKSWKNAVEASGLTPQYKHKYISRKAIVEEIKTLSIQNLKPAYIRQMNPTLYSAARRRFKSWRKAIEAAGIDFSKVDYQDKHSYSVEGIISEIRKMHKNGMAINSRSIQKRCSSFYSQVTKKIGSWDRALILAGFDPKEIRKNGFWNKNKVLEEIKKRHENGQTIYCRDMQTTFLYNRARKYFGTWRKAVEFAGIKYKKKTEFFGEKILFKMLCHFFPNFTFERHKKFPWLKYKSHMHLDVFCPDINIAIEFQGPMHYKPFYGNLSLLKQKRRDQIKKKLCKKHKINLIEIKYDQLDCSLVAEQLNEFNPNKNVNSEIKFLCEKYKRQHTHV